MLRLQMINSISFEAAVTQMQDRPPRRASAAFSPAKLKNFLRQKLSAAGSASRGDDSSDVTCFDHVLMDVVQRDASVVLDVIDDLRDLLRDDEHLSALVIREL